MLKLGTGKIDITPPKGVEFHGWITGEKSLGAWKPIHARALLFQNDQNRLLLLVLEAMGISSDHVSNIRKSICRKIPSLKPENIMICTTHSHCAPVMATSYYSCTGGDKKYLKSLVQKLTALSVNASKNLEPVTMGTASTAMDKYYINRRLMTPEGVLFAPNPKGIVDPEVSVIRFDTLSGKTKSFLINFACHPTILSGRWVHPDYPGIACAVIEKKYGKNTTAVFTNGAAGDIRAMFNPRNSKKFGGGTREAVLKFGEHFAQKVLQIAPKIKTKDTSDAKMKGISAIVPFPFEKPLTPKKFAEEIKRMETLIADFTKQNKPYHVIETKSQLNWAKLALKLTTSKDYKPWINAEIQLFRVGNLRLVALPGEVLCEIGLSIKKMIKPDKAVIIGFANDYLGYIPTAKALRERGYETDVGHKSSTNLPARYSSKLEKIILTTIKSLNKKI
jgi:hypothetical protein